MKQGETKFPGSVGDGLGDDGSGMLPPPDPAGSVLPLLVLDVGEVFSRDSLAQAWEITRKRGGKAAGGDGIDLVAFEHNAQVRLDALSRALLAGRHQPGPVAEFSVKKKSGGKRILRIPCMADRVAQRALAARLSQCLEPHFEQSSFAYRPGRSVNLAARRVTTAYRRGLTHVFEGDIDDYFDEVPHDRLFAQLAKLGLGAEWFSLLEKWFNPDVAGTAGLRPGRQGRGLPQGAPLSPVLANLYLDPLDEAMQRSNGEWVRYADDFVFLAGSGQKAERARKKCAEQLGRLGLKLHPDKTRIGRFDEGFHWLGKLFLKQFVLEDADGLDKTEIDDLEALAREPSSHRVPLQAGKADKPDGNTGLAFTGLAFTGLASGSHVGTDSNETDLGIQGDEGTSVDIPDWSSAVSRGHSPHIRTLYVLERGRKVFARGMSLVVQAAGSDLWQRHVSDIDRIDLGPGVEISPDALRMAIAARISVYFVKVGGETLTVCGLEAGHRAKLQMGQAAVTFDEENRLELCKTLVSAKIFNQRRVIQRWRYNLLEKAKRKAGGETAMLQDAERLAVHLKPMDVLRKKAENATDTTSLLGFEGPAAERLYKAVSIVSGKKRFKRQRVDAEDVLNHLMNVLSWLLARDVETSVRRRGLHPGFGFFHAPGDGRNALVYDLMEPFRAPICEALAVNCVVKKWVSQDDLPLVETGNRCLTRDGMNKVVRAYERWVSQGRLVTEDGSKTNWRGLLDRDVASYMAHVSNTGVFSTYRMDV